MSNALVPSFGRRRPEPTPSPAGPVMRQAPEPVGAGRARRAAQRRPPARRWPNCARSASPASTRPPSPPWRPTAWPPRSSACWPRWRPSSGCSSTRREQRQLALELVDDMLGLGPLEPLLEDEAITDIMVNGPDKVFVERRGKVVLSGIRFRDSQHLANIAQRIAAAVGRRVDESSPMVDARLADGSRVNIVFPPLALDGPASRSANSPAAGHRLRQAGRIRRDVAGRWPRLLEIAARCRLNIVISGGTGSGKTTLLNALSRLIDHGERIVTIEDAAELQLQQPHVVRLETRPPNLEGRGEVTQRDLRAQRAAHAARPHHRRRGAAAPRPSTCCRR